MVKYSISQDASQQLRTILNNQSRPRIGYADVTRCLIQGFILNKTIWTRNYFERLHKLGGATKEIISRAKQNLGRNQRQLKKETSRLMRQRVETISS